MLRVLVLADTHVRTVTRQSLPEVVWEAAQQADAILHAGDVLSMQLLTALAEYAPTCAVLGNNDVDLADRLPERRVVEFAGLNVAMVHDSGPRAGRERRLRRWFPDAPLVVFGHSHEPCNAIGVDGQRLFNPGSPTQRRRQPRATFGWITFSPGRDLTCEIIPVDQPSAPASRSASRERSS